MDIRDEVFLRFTMAKGKRKEKFFLEEKTRIATVIKKNDLNSEERKIADDSLESADVHIQQSRMD